MKIFHFKCFTFDSDRNYKFTNMRSETYLYMLHVYYDYYLFKFKNKFSVNKQIELFLQIIFQFITFTIIFPILNFIDQIKTYIINLS